MNRYDDDNDFGQPRNGGNSYPTMNRYREAAQHREEKHVSPELRRRSRIGITLGYLCTVALTVLLIVCAIASSLLMVVGNQKGFLDIAGSYAMNLQQQKDIEAKVEKLATKYHFDPTLTTEGIDVAALSQFSQDTVAYWYQMLHGKTAGSLPVWDTAAIKQAVLADPTFTAAWPAEEQPKKADEIAGAMGTAIQSAIFPMKQMPLTLGLMFLSGQKYLDKIAMLNWIAIIGSVALLAAIRIIQNNRPFQSLWFYGVAGLTACLGMTVFIYRLGAQAIDAIFQTYNNVLSLYASEVITSLETYLRSFSIGFFLAGAVLLIAFFSFRYQRLHSTHHELSTFF